MSFVGSNILAGASGQGGGGYEISRSLRFNPVDTAYLNRTPSSASNRKTWTWSAWIKRGKINAETCIFTAGSGTANTIRFNSDGRLKANAGSDGSVETVAVFRDPSAWYHIIVVLDTTQATASDRLKIYVNSVLQDVTGTYPTQNSDGSYNEASVHYLGRQVHNTSNLFDGYLAEINFIDGQALAPTDFGEFDDDNVWQPKKFAGSYTSYNNSKTWSSSTGITDSSGTRSSAYIFDGVITGSHSNGFNTYNSTITLANSVTATSSIRFYGAFENATGVRYTVNGTTTDAQPPEFSGNTAFGWASATNVSFPVTINNVGLTDSSTTNGGRFVGIEIDGKLLIDSGVSVVSNSFKLDFNDNSSNAALGLDTSGNSNNFTVHNLIAGRESVSTDTIASVSGNVLTFPSSNNFSSFAVNDVVQAAGSYNRYVTSSITPSSPPSTSSMTDSGSQVFEVLPTDSGGKFLVAELATAVDSLVFRYFESHTVTTNPTTYGPSYVSDNGSSWTQVDASFVTGLGYTISNGSPHKYFAVASVAYNGAYSFGNNSAGNYWTFTDGVGTPKITAINASGPTVTVNGGKWYGANGSGTSGGSTVLSTTAVTNGDNFVDSPSNGDPASDTGLGGQITANYAVLNPLDRQSTNGTLSNGNLDLTWNTATWVIYRATMHVSYGKWFWEVTLGNNQYSIFGIIPTDYSMGTSNNYWIAQVPNAYCFYPYTGNKYDNTASSSYATADTSGSGTVYGMALDLDAGTMTYYKNGVSLGTAFTGITGSFAPAAGLYNQSGNDSYNFGQRAFSHPVSGYKSLNTANLSFNDCGPE